MLVCASTDCYVDHPFDDALSRLVDLEFTNVEVVMREGGQLAPSLVAQDLEAAIETCRNTHRLDVLSYFVDMPPTVDGYYDNFTAICKLAKATKVVHLTVPSGELGTPFNEEVERLRKLVAIAQLEGVVVSIRSYKGCLSEDPDTVAVLCDNVEGLGLTLDPSHYICGPHAGRSIDKLMKYVYHVHLRDTSKDELQVRIGQGEVEYGRLVSQLRKVDYRRALCVHFAEVPDLDHMVEMRKMRLLLESLL